MVSQSIEIKATPKRCYEVITDYEGYRDFLSSVDDVVVSNKKGNTCEVTYTIKVIKEISYTLKMKATPPSKVEWSLVKSNIMKDNHGHWELEEVKKGVTLATYNVDIKFGLLVPGSVTKILVDKHLPAMLKDFKKRIEVLKK
ncbi:MAG TPA: SRPBCC family protein [bacterium]|nr:SRPBCC family protein [bacterium]